MCIRDSSCRVAGTPARCCHDPPSLLPPPRDAPPRSPRWGDGPRPSFRLPETTAARARDGGETTRAGG
eukprot:7960652-Alexandrium_andersonii.AAC.1